MVSNNIVRMIVQDIVRDIEDRIGLANAWEEIDDHTKWMIMDTWEEIIKEWL